MLTFRAKRIRCVWGKTAFSGVHTSCVKVFRSRGQWCRRRGCNRTPKNFDLVKIHPLKSGKNLCKFKQNVWKPSRNRFVYFDFTKWRPKWKCRRFFLLEVMFCSVFFEQVRGNLGKFGENLGKNGAWSALIWKNAPKMKLNAVVFFRSFS